MSRNGNTMIKTCLYLSGLNEDNIFDLSKYINSKLYKITLFLASVLSLCCVRSARTRPSQFNHARKTCRGHSLQRYHYEHFSSRVGIFGYEDNANYKVGEHFCIFWENFDFFYEIEYSRPDTVLMKTISMENRIVLIGITASFFQNHES